MLEHVAEAIHEAADAAVNPTGYADDGEEADRRSELRDKLEDALRAVVVAVTQQLEQEGTMTERNTSCEARIDGEPQGPSGDHR